MSRSADPKLSARRAGLKYVTDSHPGLVRVRVGKNFSYRTAKGAIIRRESTLARIRSLAIPPAWTDVWICADPNGHIQAVGRDARGRKQYRYHPEWNNVRDDLKYGRMIAFAEALPGIRQRVNEHLALRGLPREKVLAAVVRLLETTLIRVGNDEYARTTGSVGLTTMQNDHVQIDGSKLQFEFRGKSGVEHEVDLEDKRLARIVRQCQELPGQELFEYLDEDGNVRDVRSDDVNRYLQEISGRDFTAKDFRTWAGTALAARALQEFEDFDNQAAAKRNVTQAIERVASQLGNTKTVCRKSYVHPAVIASYLDKTLVETLKRRTEERLRQDLHSLTPEEAAVLALLQQRMERDLKPRRRRVGGSSRA
ncbi:MAG: DNA topoisomerase IB [Planctomycetaceae bacterium]|nr:DNA topoisomerase IB [Planctomycetaceae bacterium]